MGKCLGMVERRSCQEVVAALAEFIAGELPPLERRSVALHLDGCSSCTCYASSYRQTVSLLRATRSDERRGEIPPALLQAILARALPA